MKPERVTVLRKIKKIVKDSDGLMRLTKMSRAPRTDVGDRGQDFPFGPRWKNGD